MKNDEKNELTIQEFAELEKQGECTLLCEEIYNGGTITSAISKGKQALISALRTISLYPPGLYAAKIAESVTDLYNTPSDQSIALFFNDRDFLSKNRKKSKDVDEPDELDETPGQEPQELDGLLEDNNAIKNLADPVKVEEDASLHIEEES